MPTPPHFIHALQPVLAAAGIWTARKIAEVWEVSTSIITRDARDASGELHVQMPVFLQSEVFGRWLDTEKLVDDAQKADMLTLLDHVSAKVASTITTYEVDRKVNNSRTVNPADESLIAPVQS